MLSSKKGHGRPRKSSVSKKSESVLLRMEQREKAGFQAAANLSGIPLAVWMRERLRRDAARELTEGGQRVPFLPGANG
jgi:hypothetical protein